MMKKLTRQLLIVSSTMGLIFGGSFLLAKSDTSQVTKLKLPVGEAISLRFQNPDSAINTLQRYYNNSIKNQDTTTAIRALMGLAETFGNQANYKESYDRLWTALLLADGAGMELRKATIYKAIGRYYSFYKRKQNSLKFLELALSIKKGFLKQGELDEGILVDNYHAFTATFRELKEPEKSKKYLDSCFLYYSPAGSQINISFLKFEQAVLLTEDGKYEKAIETFNSTLPWFVENTPSYQVLVYYYLGVAYVLSGDFLKSEQCYRKALAISKEYNSHIDFTPLVHEKLSDLYFKKGDLLEAYEQLKIVKELDEKFFDSRSENNRPLLEIQDEFRNEQEHRAKLLREQRLEQLEHADKVLLLQRTILIGSLVFLVLIGIIYFNHVRSKHRAEKQIIKKKQELETQKTNEILELKNKELAASALKLIEKDTFIDTLKDKLSQSNGEINRQEIKQIVNSISNSNAKNWKEFEARFVSVNKSFYEKLNQSYPTLTQGDQKLCALVKLNFSSKEMAKLLGISVESVHTTRYRLRKKLKLSREVNLTEFIANV